MTIAVYILPTERSLTVMASYQRQPFSTLLHMGIFIFAHLQIESGNWFPVRCSFKEICSENGSDTVAYVPAWRCQSVELCEKNWDRGKQGLRRGHATINLSIEGVLLRIPSRRSPAPSAPCNMSGGTLNPTQFPKNVKTRLKYEKNSNNM